MKQLIHNGVYVRKYEWKGLSIKVEGKRIRLNPKQEEMAIAWVKKLETEYVKDKIFVKNFFEDFCRALNLKKKIGPEKFDFSEVIQYVEEERKRRESLSKEEKMRLREERRALREALKEKFGYAMVDGVKIEVSNYIAEPSCIFMGRGKHPKRGRWKEGPEERDIELNLSPDAPRPPGNWKCIIWKPNVMWIARWRDKLSGKMKYVWLSENSHLKQMRDIEKFKKAAELGRNIEKIKQHIMENLDSEDLIRRKTATVCYLIDRLKIRVGDEKDPEEADTVGASTLRPEHVKFLEDGTVIFNFLGKDSVPHMFRVKLPEKVIRNLKEFISMANSPIFDGVNSKRVSEFLDEVMEGLSAKVFRTYYASKAVEDTLKSILVKKGDPDYYKKYVASIANLEAAKVCNHKRKIPKNWREVIRKREEKLREYLQKHRGKARKLEERMKKRREHYIAKIRVYEDKILELKEKEDVISKMIEEKERRKKPVKALKRRLQSTVKARRKREEMVKKLRKRCKEEIRKLQNRLLEIKRKDRERIRKAKLQIDIRKKTRNYNLNTSLKSYIDPRIYYRWGMEVNFDWKLYYPKSLQRRFSWVEKPIFS